MKVGYPAPDIVQVNNMAREFKQADGLSFDQAMKAEGEITPICTPIPCEASYTEGLALWNVLTG